MASTITGLSANNAMMTEQCLLDFANGVHKTDGSHTYKLALLNLANGALTITQAATKKYADITTAETSGTGYSAGGITLGTPSVSVSSRKMSMTFTVVDPTNCTFTTDAWVIYNDTATGTGTQAKPILAIGKFDAAKSPVAGTLDLTIPADVINITAAAPA